MDDDQPLAVWKDLCMDASSPRKLAGFWSAVLGLSPAGAGGNDLVLKGDSPAETIWVNQVPEPKAVKHRVHLDVEVADLAGLRGLGASVLREPTAEDYWWVMADPEGGAFCAFLTDDVGSLPGRLKDVVVDCADPHAQQEWWGGVLGLQPEEEPKRHFAALQNNFGPQYMPFRFLCFVPVPEPKAAKNRIHWDLTAEIEPLVERGASILREPDDEVRWHVLADPEGNEFCVFAPSG